MGIHTANYYESLFQFALELSECESCFSLVDTIVVSLEKWFDIEATACLQTCSRIALKVPGKRSYRSWALGTTVLV